MAIYPSETINKKQNVVVRASNRFTIVMGGKPVGMLQDLRCQDDYSPEPASGIGSIYVKEYVPTLARYTISTSQACMFKGALRQIGVSFQNGDDAMRGLVFDIEVHDRTIEASVKDYSSTGTNTPGLEIGAEGEEGTLLRRYEKCSFASGDIEIRKHAIIITSATINACEAPPANQTGPSETGATSLI